MPVGFLCTAPIDLPYLVVSAHHITIVYWLRAMEPLYILRMLHLGEQDGPCFVVQWRLSPPDDCTTAYLPKCIDKRTSNCGANMLFDNSHSNNDE
jgi:hypothetical protein